MAQRRKKNSGLNGPYVCYAAFCEKVLQEKDGVVSLVRIVDRITLTPPPGVAFEQASLPPFALTLAIGLKSGDARGTHQITVRGRSPVGGGEMNMNLSALFEGDDRGVALFATVNLQLKDDGLYWFDVLFEGQRLTSVPLRVLVQQTQLGTSTVG